jgi:hypothetical protein
VTGLPGGIDPAAVLAALGLPPPEGPGIVASGSTWPVVLFPDMALKLFPGPRGATAQAAEVAVLRHLARDPAIPAPSLLAAGSAPLPCLVTRRMTSPAWTDEPPDADVARKVATDIGEAVARMRALGHGPLPRSTDLPHVPLRQALAATVLPAHLHAPLAALAAAYPPTGQAFVHADLTDRHVLIGTGRLAGLLDWGDACAAHPMMELPKLHLGLFAADRSLLAAFMEAAGWCPGPDFADRALALCVWRQAQGLVQHPGSMDVFYRLPSLLQPADMADPARLATRLFAIY